MTIISKPMGAYATNCYIVTIDDKSLIIDPGMGASEWVIKNAKNPVAILNTHGHFDHIWSNSELKKALNIPLYIPKDDAFMLLSDPFSQGTPKCEASVLAENGVEYDEKGVKFKFIHFAGHTPGTSIILIGDVIFSGDFIFKGSIGRVDFPYSNPQEMKKSIEKFIKNFHQNMTIYSGHGKKTTVNEAKEMLKGWLNYL